MSPQRTLISQMGKHIGETIQLFGRVISIREVGSIRFADIQDRSGRGQIVIGPETPLPKLQSIISCSGVVVKSVKSFTGFEVHAEKITIISSPLEECTYNPEDITSP